MKTEILLSGNSGNTEKEIRGGWSERLERKRESSIGTLEIARARRKWWNTRKHGIIFNFDLERPTLEIPVIAVKSREAARGLGTTPSPPRGVKKRERKTVKRGKRGGGNGRRGGRRRGRREKGESGKPNNRPASTSVSVRSRRKRGDEMDRPTDRNLHPLVRNLRE